MSDFPSPYEIAPPEGCDGWEEMYPYYTLFHESRREADESRFWFWNSMHFPVPMPSFDVQCIDAPYQAVGEWQNRFFAVPPAMGIDYRIVNGYVYISGNPVTDPEKIGERVEYFQRRAGYYFEHWEELYAGWKQKMEALIEEITNLPVPELPEYEPDALMEEAERNTTVVDALTAYSRTLRCGDLMWQHHFELLLLGYGAYVTFSDFCKSALPDIPEQHIAQMVAGIDVILFRPSGELLRLAKLAIETEVDAAFAEGRTPAEIDAELGESDAGRAWLEELERTKDPWFNMATGDGLYHYYRSWYDDPTIPYASIVAYVRALNEGEETERPTEEVERERDRLAEEYGALLDDDARTTFTELLGLSRMVFPYVEEHKFFCDYWFLTRWWNKLREFGALLAGHGFLEDGEDVFNLGRHEVAMALDELLLTWATVVRRSARRTGRRSSSGGRSCSSGWRAGSRRRRSALRRTRSLTRCRSCSGASPPSASRRGRKRTRGRRTPDGRRRLARHGRGHGTRRDHGRRALHRARGRHPRLPDHVSGLGADLPECAGGGH